MEIIQIAHKHILGTFCKVLVMSICDLQIDLIMPEPHHVKFLLSRTLYVVTV